MPKRTAYTWKGDAASGRCEPDTAGRAGRNGAPGLPVALTALWTALPLAAAALVYAVLVLTPQGRFADDASFHELGPVSGRLAGYASLYRTVVPFLLAALALGLGILALLRRRVADALGAAAVVVCSFALAEGLKIVLPRPGVPIIHAFVGNTFPSGHTAFSLSIAFAIALLAPAGRGWDRAAAWSAWFAAGVSAASVVAMAHRPSDVIGAAFLVTAVAFAALAVRRPKGAPDAPRTRFLAWWGVAAVTALLALPLVALGTASEAAGDRGFASGAPGWLLACTVPALLVVALGSAARRGSRQAEAGPRGGLGTGAVSPLAAPAEREAERERVGRG